MNRLMIATAAMTCLTALPLAAQAGPRDHGVNARQHNQQHRIVQGIRSGELTRGETRRLQTQQGFIRHKEQQFRADGSLTGAERSELQHDLNRSSRSIYNQKHDGQQRPWAAGGYPGVRDPGVNAQQWRQGARIGQGVRSGELTGNEVAALRGEQRAIRLEEREYKSDGVLSRAERRDLHQDLRESSRSIYEQKHDDDRRY